jgi:hypothetical protein
VLQAGRERTVNGVWTWAELRRTADGHELSVDEIHGGELGLDSGCVSRAAAWAWSTECCAGKLRRGGVDSGEVPTSASEGESVGSASELRE